MSPAELSQNPESYPGFGLTEGEIQIFDLWADDDELPVGHITPEETREQLEKMGYARETWNDIAASGSVYSHEMTMFAIVSLGETPRIAYIIISNLRALDYLDNNPRLKSEIGILPTLRDTTMHTEALKAAIREKHVEFSTSASEDTA